VKITQRLGIQKQINKKAEQTYRNFLCDHYFLVYFILRQNFKANIYMNKISELYILPNKPIDNNII